MALAGLAPFLGQCLAGTCKTNIPGMWIRALPPLRVFMQLGHTCTKATGTQNHGRAVRLANNQGSCPSQRKHKQQQAILELG